MPYEGKLNCRAGRARVARDTTGVTAMRLLDLPEDVLGNICYHTSPAEVCALEKSCRRLRQTVAQQQLWRAMDSKFCPLLLEVVKGVDDEDPDWLKLRIRTQKFRGRDSKILEQVARQFGTVSTEIKVSAVYKKLISRLERRDEPLSLLWRPLCASSTGMDGGGLESILHRYNHSVVAGLTTRPSYWSSRPASHPNANESIILQLVHPLCLVRRVRVRALKDKNGFHGPSAMRLRLGRTDPSLIQEGTGRQTFVLPPTLCPGGLMKIELLGRSDKQPSSVKLVSIQVYGVVISDMHLTHHGMLKPLLGDAVRDGLGLQECSHGGRSQIPVPRFDSSDSDDCTEDAPPAELEAYWDSFL